MRRYVALGFVLGLLIGQVGPLAAQGNLWDGRFVGTGDGACYVVIGNTSHRLQPALIARPELEALAAGEPIATVTQLLALAGGAPPAAVPPAEPPAAPPAAAPATPAHTLLLTRTFRICKEGRPFLIEVVEVDWTRNVVTNGRQRTANGMFVVVVAQVTNLGQQRINLGFREPMIRDERGRTWMGWPDNLNIGADNTLLTSYGAQTANREFEPNRPLRILFLFDVAPDVNSLELFTTENC